MQSNQNDERRVRDFVSDELYFLTDVRKMVMLRDGGHT